MAKLSETLFLQLSMHILKKKKKNAWCRLIQNPLRSATLKMRIEIKTKAVEDWTFYWVNDCQNKKLFIDCQASAHFLGKVYFDLCCCEKLMSEELFTIS